MPITPGQDKVRHDLIFQKRTKNILSEAMLSGRTAAQTAFGAVSEFTAVETAAELEAFLTAWKGAEA